MTGGERVRRPHGHPFMDDRPRRGPVLHGVELHNFMSYESAFVPLTPGLNLIVGPNGSGKSSILVALSLALGQAHTERSRRLSDLIRWGTDGARVSLILDNATPDGGKLFPHHREEKITITRVLRANGEYFYQLDGRPIPKQDIAEAFRRAGIYPDNMLIIMHQLMVHRFATVPPPEKLRMMEEALGFASYRDEVLEALTRLRRAGEEEKTLAAVLQSTEQSREYWRREYAKLQRRRQLEARLVQLDAELAWTKVSGREAAVARVRERIAAARTELTDLEAKAREADRQLEGTEAMFRGLRAERQAREGERLEAAKQQAVAEAESRWSRDLAPAETAPARDLEARAAGADVRAAEWTSKLEQLETHLTDLERALDEGLNALVDRRVDGQVVRFRARLVAEELGRSEAHLASEQEDLDALRLEAERLGPRVGPRKLGEVHAEMASIKEELGPLGGVSEDVEKVYANYMQSFEQLKARTDELAAGRKALGEEAEKRMAKWREVVGRLLGEVNADFNELLREAEGAGGVRLTEGRDLERIGLDILAGFRGQEPTSLDSFAQSGGERSIALTAFLLALQRRAASPIRAIDEFDVHLDPHNRELVSKVIVASAKAAGNVQYIAITPGQVAPPKGVNVIVVQNVGGKAVIGRRR